MNAKEVYDLYAPLWARVPETRPTIRINNKRTKTLAFAGEWTWESSDPWDSGATDDDSIFYTAALLCRVAVEDWLADNGAWPQLGPTQTPYRLGHAIGKKWTEATETTEGATIHHALVAAAMAVAERLEPDRH